MRWAIGLGGIATESFVNEPLNATIEVLQPSGLSEVEVIPSLASIDDFDRLGLDRHYSLSRLLFEPDFPVSSRLAIRIGDQTGAAALLQSLIPMGDAAQCEQARALLDSLD
jgi:pilus assembly protein FimV